MSDDDIKALREALAACKGRLPPFGALEIAASPDRIARLLDEVERLRADAERYRWLRDNPLWSVGYRLKRGKREWRMRDEGEYWGEWWPTHEQAVDHAMALNKAIEAARGAA
jgi:hypothetical protein